MATEIASIDEIVANQSQKEVTHNTALRQLEGRLFRVKDRDVGTTPASPVNGDTYIVDQLGGAWSTAAINDIAHFFGGAWNFYTPFEGIRLWVNDENVLVIYDGAIWTIFAQTRANTNVIINGNFDIWQRGTSFAAIATGTYTADRFRWDHAGTGVVTVLRSTSVPDNKSDFSLQVDVTTADTSIAVGDFYSLGYKVEGYDAMRFGFGTADATQLTLSFRCRSSKTGIHCVAFRNSANDRSYIVEFTIAVADTYESFTITLTADTTGTWLTDSGNGLIITWALAAGTTFQTAANVWTAGNFLATSNQVNVMDNVANNFHISRVQLEVGGADTAFERRHFAQELALCQRYYAKTFPQATVPAQNAGLGGALVGLASGTAVGHVSAVWEFPVVMRAPPTIVTYNPSVANADWRDTTAGADVATGIQRNSDKSAEVFNNAVAIDTNHHDIHMTADGEL